MLWCIVLETDGQYHQYSQLIPREDALQLIERNFEQGELTRKIYTKKSIYLWENATSKVHLVNEKHLKDFM